MTQMQTQMTAAMMLPAAMAAETVARMVALAAWQANAMLSPGRSSGWRRVEAAPAAPAPFDPVAEAQAPEADHGADTAELRPVAGTMTAARDMADGPDHAADRAQDITALVGEATGAAPRSLDEMLPAKGRPVE